MRSAFSATVACVALAALAGSAMLGAAQGPERRDKDSGKEQDKRPKMTLRARPNVAISPARVSFVAELQGGANDFADYYCATVEWDWGDDTRSESTADCDPYEAGKSEIKRRFVVEHTFRRNGVYKIYFHLKRKDKIVGSATVTVQVQPGGRDGLLN